MSLSFIYAKTVTPRQTSQSEKKPDESDIVVKVLK